MRPGWAAWSFLASLSTSSCSPPMIPYRRTSVESRGRQRDGNRIVMHVQADEHDGRFVPRPVGADLALDSFGRAEYVLLHGVCFPFDVYVSVLEHWGSAPRLRSGRNPRSRKTDTFFTFIASHTD